MFCSKCGTVSPDGNAFCSNCGAPIKQASAPASPQYGTPTAPQYGPPPVTQYAPPPPVQQYGYQQGYAPAVPKKKKTGLIIGLITGAAVLLGAAAAVYFLVLAGTPITGLWYSDEKSTVFEFRDKGEFIYHTINGTQDATYKYDKQKGEGTLYLNGDDYDFTVDKDTLTVKSDGSKVTLKKADKDFDTEKYLSGCIEGYYSNKAHDEVIELNEGKAAVSYNNMGNVTGTYTYDFDKGSGTISFNGNDITFSASATDIYIDTYGSYTKEAEGFDAASFVVQYGNPLIGDWYDTAGQYGQFTFAADGTFTLAAYGQTFTGTYTYNNSTGMGTVSVNGTEGNFTYSDGTLMLEGETFTQNYVEQNSVSLINTWYDTSGYMGTLTFYSDDTVEFYYAPASTDFYGTYTFDYSTGTGTVTINFAGSYDSYSISLTGGTLNLNNGEAYFTTEYVDQSQ